MTKKIAKCSRSCGAPVTGRRAGGRMTGQQCRALIATQGSGTAYSLKAFQFYCEQTAARPESVDEEKYRPSITSENISPLLCVPLSFQGQQRRSAESQESSAQFSSLDCNCATNATFMPVRSVHYRAILVVPTLHSLGGDAAAVVKQQTKTTIRRIGV
jgi:hypothetical protein